MKPIELYKTYHVDVQNQMTSYVPPHVFSDCMHDLSAGDLVNFGMVNQAFWKVAKPYIGGAKSKVRIQKTLYDRIAYIDRVGMSKGSINIFGIPQNRLKLNKFSIESGTHIKLDVLCDAMDIILSLLHKPAGCHYPISIIERFLDRDDLFDIVDEVSQDQIKIFQTVVSIHACLYTFWRHDHHDLLGIHNTKRGARIGTIGDQIICALTLKYIKMAMDVCHHQCCREALQHMVTLTTIVMTQLSQRAVSSKVNTFMAKFVERQK